MSKVFKPWAHSGCDHCGDEFQVTRSDERKITGDVLCSDCDLYEKAYKDGVQSAAINDQASKVRLKMINHAFNEYTKTVSNIMAHTNAHIMRIGRPFNQGDSNNE
jgi:hypothetical protein